jgi:DMSO/TMAO reductase YedYZ molybdopterin-dependent catalytic subunit
VTANYANSMSKLKLYSREYRPRAERQKRCADVSKPFLVPALWPRVACTDRKRKPRIEDVRREQRQARSASPPMYHPLAPHQLRDRVTRTEDVIVLCHLGVPRFQLDQWSLTIDGLVERPRALQFKDLARHPKTEVASVHNCCGSPFAPLEPTRRVSNVRWGGVRLAHILADCGPAPTAKYLWSYGADYGSFSEVSVESSMKDLPITRIESDVLVAYEMNGKPL